jgi:uncharacterized OsmC-like protein
MHMRGQAERHFGVRLRLLEKFQFESQAYEGERLHGAPFRSDEPDPIGDTAGPSTPALLASAIGHCLTASLVEISRHAAFQLSAVETDAVAVVAPNADGLPRIKRVEVTITPTLKSRASDTMLKRCEGTFRRYCTVCSSLEPAFPVNVSVDWRLHTEAPALVN